MLQSAKLFESHVIQYLSGVSVTYLSLGLCAVDDARRFLECGEYSKQPSLHPSLVE